MIKAGIIGGAGYTGGELIRILLNHPQVEIGFIQSESQVGRPVSAVHQDLIGEIDLVFSKHIEKQVDVIFVCSGHGKSKALLTQNVIDTKTCIIDLSQDFRLQANAKQSSRQFVYGLPEFNLTKIKEAKDIANPGCFATAIQLAFLPLFADKKLKDDIHINAITGSTGAGQSLSDTSHFSWRNNNLSVYKAFTHQHLAEISETFNNLQPGYDKAINFIPIRGNFTRGILANAYTNIDMSFQDILDLYKNFYSDSPFTHVTTENISLKQVINTNKCILHLEKHDGKLLVSSIIDNLLKGASGQAVQNMNLIFNLPEKTGLTLKPSSF